jgi:hypothetical protein
MVLLFIGGVAAILIIVSVLAIGSNVMGALTNQVVEGAIGQLNEDPSISAKQISINICSGLINIRSCDAEQDSVVTAATQEEEILSQPLSPWPIIIGMTFIIGLAVFSVLFAFSSDSP